MKTRAAITFDQVSKTFKLPHEKNTSVKSLALNFYKGNRTFERLHALNDVSFEINQGEFFGIVGRNGSGKSTLLKLMAGIYSPDKGDIKVNGKLTPFIELGVGFNQELTGRENVFLNGALLGFSRKEMERMYPYIVEFAEIEKFMDQKLKNYSSGMQVRLAFSIAIRSQSDILVLDEVLAVGDIDFQQKCYRYFSEIKKDKKTVVLVTHDMGAVRRFCDRGILLDAGKIVEGGKPDKIAKAYERLNLDNAEKRLAKVDDKKYQKRQGNGDAIISKVETFNAKTGKAQATFMADEKIGVRIVCKAKHNVNHPTLGFIFQDAQDVTVFATSNHVKDIATPEVQKGQTVELEAIVENVFTNGEYTITSAIESDDLTTIYDRIEYIHRFYISGHQLSHATTHPSHSLKAEVVKV